MTFAYPWVFWLLIPALLTLLKQERQNARRAIAYPFNTAPSALRSSLKLRFLFLPSALRLISVTALAFALARPQVEVLDSSIEREGIAIELLVDISSSMDVRMSHGEKQNSRLGVAKDVIRQFIQGNGEDLPGRPNDLIGMITFARYADTVSPLTHSHDALAFLTENLSINDRPNEDGTAYGDACALAAARLSRMEQHIQRNRKPGSEVKSKIIVLLTDGENNCGKILPLQAAALAKEWDIRIYAISITEPPKSQFVRVDNDESIEAARTRSAAERALEKMATTTGGIYRAAYDFASLKDVYGEIDRLERSKIGATLRRIQSERFPWFALVSLALLATELLLDSTWLRRIP